MPTRLNTWLRRGFLPQEAIEFSRISAAGMKAPYIQAMIRKRISLNAARVRYGWTKREYRKRILDEYKAKGVRRMITPKTIWDYFSWWKDTVPIPDDWTSPGKKRRRRTTRRVQSTKRDMLRNKISSLNDQITRAIRSNDQRLRRTLELERNRYQNQLDALS